MDKDLQWVAISGVAGILVIVSLAVFLNAPSHTGAFQTGPTLADTGGLCIPNGETGCSLEGAVNCCHPASCVNRIGAAYLVQGVCKIPYSTA